MPGQENTERPHDDELFEKLQVEGESEERAARIAGSAANRARTQVDGDGEIAPPYDQWTVEELRQRAHEVGLEGDSLSKRDLIDALREH